MTVSMQKTLAALNLPTSVPELLAVADVIVQAMTGNPAFPAPTPSLAAVSAAIGELWAAEVASRTRAHGTVAVRNGKRAALITQLVRLKAYVQSVADDDPERAATLIQSAGMHVKKRGTRGKPPFEAKQGAVSGSVRLAVRSAGDRACYHWAWSSDGGTTWRTVPATLQADTVLTGLPSGSTCAFRCRLVTRTGEGDWSEPVALLVR